MGINYHLSVSREYKLDLWTEILTEKVPYFVLFHLVLCFSGTN